MNNEEKVQVNPVWDTLEVQWRDAGGSSIKKRRCFNDITEVVLYFLTGEFYTL